jgi:hypothetical protein
MISLVTAWLLTASCVAPAPGSPPSETLRVRRAAVDSAYRRLFDGGVSFADFLRNAKARKEMWDRNYASGTVADALVTRARGAGGPWKLLVVAVDGCSDSVNTIPYLARLVEQLPGTELRVVDSDIGRWVMDAHRTPDGRSATPTVILLDASYEERGCWIERPAELQRWMIDNKGKLEDSALVTHKMAWYDEDKGARTVADVVAMLEAAARGEKRC